MKTFKIDENFIPNKSTEYVYDINCIKQILQDRLKILKGELSYNTSLGIPIGLNKDSVDIAVLDIIKNTYGVVSAYFVGKSTLSADRVYTASVVVNTVYNSQININI